ncbi:helix-turn-helix domain-containing protein [Dankookia rubra]|uniref:helix-turn-helix domain-containing protein n=1 Tax=Dankookia rubra TaxID=1442381 RepID=UPI00140AE29C|nr:helix-turn-helix domain-containing protein [Dankookia rubra]
MTEVAADLGFFHFARFSAEYRELFHELPSETLRRARQETGLLWRADNRQQA